MAINLNSVNLLNNGGNIPYDTITLNSATAGTPPTFQKAVVEEVFFNPKELTNEERQRIRSLVANPDIVDQLPANSVMAVLVSDGVSQAIPTRVILTPFFQTHFMLPVQAGEQVSVIFEDFQKYNFLNGKWVTRISENLSVEDPNFTHGDRRYYRVTTETERTSVASERSNTRLIYTPDFPNGGRQENSFSLPFDGNINPYDAIQKTASASLMHSYEPVPRWSKRPHEFVLQGMNNSLIMVGRDRIGSVSSSSPQEQKKYAGSIDLVTGRSRYLLTPQDSTITSEHYSTSPFIVTNSRGLLEIDKSPKVNSRTEQPKEGDPDFSRDAARVYISMKTLGDINFKLQNTIQGNSNNAMQASGINYSPRSLQPIQPSSASAEVGNSYIINKADNIRLIARRTLPSENPQISGSILLVKEGINRTPEDPTFQTSNTDHLAYLYMTPEGRIQIDGMQIFLGGAALNTTPSPSTTNPQFPATDIPSNEEGALASNTDVGIENHFAGAEPYIKWSEFKNVVQGLQNQIQTLYVAYNNLVDNLNAANVQSVCPPMGKDTAWIGLYNSSVTNRLECRRTLNSQITETNKAVYRARSAKIFGQ